MKTNKTLPLLLFLFFTAGIPDYIQAAEAGNLIVSVKYFMYNNKIPFIQVDSKTKVDKKLQPVPGIDFLLYLDSASDNRLIGKIKTNEMGRSTIAIPTVLKVAWNASPKHTFICNSAATKAFEESEQELEITQAKLQFDTINDGDVRSIVATFMEKTDKGWSPIPETDVKIGVKRLGGILSAGTDETYATDEKGEATVAFDREKLPGDKNGNLTLIVKVEDNETYGNLVTEMSAAWGVKAIEKYDSFNERSLWATSTRAPIWLLILANSIIVTVWGVIIYLIFQLSKLRKLGINQFD